MARKRYQIFDYIINIEYIFIKIYLQNILLLLSLHCKVNKYMGKRKAHYSLAQIKILLKSKHYRITSTARKNALEDFNLLENDIIEIIISLNLFNFYKSMTTRYDSQLWQDVYHKKINSKSAYIKLQILDNNTIIISFKEL
jgi:motility quorum-sensing regulator / GCU-specific mRNA interferase toxin